MFLGDLLYGVIALPRRVAQLACRRVGSHFLLRASRSVRAADLQRLARRDTAGGPGGPVIRTIPAASWNGSKSGELRVRVGRNGHALTQTAVVDQSD